MVRYYWWRYVSVSLAALCERLGQRLQEVAWRLNPDFDDGARYDRLWLALSQAGEQEVREIEEKIGRELVEEELCHFLDRKRGQ